MHQLAEEFVFDPTDLAVHEDPYPLYRRLREHSPVYHNPEVGFWALSRHSDVLAAEKDWQTYTGKYGVDLDDTSNQFGEGVPPRGFFLGYDPPRHTAVRKALQDRFLPRGLLAIEPMVRRKCEELVAAFINHGCADIAEVFATPLPDLVFAELLGFPRDEHPRLSKLLRKALQRDLLNLPPPFIPPDSVQAGAELQSALKEIISARRGLEPRDDLIGRLLAARPEGEEMEDQEIVGTVFFIFTAGTEEVTGLITNALWLLAQHPDQRAALVSDPSRIAGAVEESLRFETIVQHLVKTTTRDVELHERVIPEGARVVLLYGSANRDERQFDESERFDVSRRVRGLASFGGGIHRCLGAPLARLEARLALETLLPLMSEYRVDGPVEWSQRVNFRGLRRLPLAWT